MMDDIEQRIKLQLLEELIEEMGGKDGERMRPKGVAVEVAAPDKSKLAEGLDKAKGMMSGDEGESDSEEADEDRLMQLMDEDEDEEKAGRR